LSDTDPTTPSSRKTIKVGLDGDDCRQTRQRNTIELRKNRREEMQHKRRKMMYEVNLDGDTGDAADDIEIDATNEDTTHPGARVMRVARLSEEELQARFVLVAQNGADLFSSDPKTQLKCVVRLRELTSIDMHKAETVTLPDGRKMKPVSALVSIEVVPALLKLLSVPFNTVRERVVFEATWVLSNIAAGEHSDTETVVKKGGIPVLLNLLQHPVERVRDQATWAIGNIAGDGAQLRDAMLQHKAVSHLIASLQPKTDKVDTMRNFAWALANMCRFKPPPPFEAIRPMIPAVVALLQYPDTDVVVDAMWCMQYIVDGVDEEDDAVRVHAIIQAKAIPVLIGILQTSDNHQVLIPLLQAVTNLMNGAKETTDVLIEANVITPLGKMLTHTRELIRAKACRALSNIAAGALHQANLIVSADLVPKLVELLKSDANSVQSEVIWCLTNLMSTAYSHSNLSTIQFLIDYGVVPLYCVQLESPSPDTLDVTLRGLTTLLEVAQLMNISDSTTLNRVSEEIEKANGNSMLLKLADHENSQISELAQSILDTYFQVDEYGPDEGEPTNAPTQSENTNTFAFLPGLANAPFAAGHAAAPSSFSFGDGASSSDAAMTNE
jgi:hypothetical protein